MNAPPEEPRVIDPIETPVQKSAPTGWAPPKHTLLTTSIVIVAALAGILIVLYAWELWPFARTIQSTDNAYVRGQTTLISPQVSGYVVAVPVQDYEAIKAGEVLAQIDDRIYRQRVDQARANLAAAMANRDNSAQTLRSKHATAAAQAAALESARAQLLRAQADTKRVDELIADGSVSLRERDQTLAALRAAEATVNQSLAAGEIAKQDIVAVEVSRGGLDAAVESAQATLKLAEIDLANTTIRSPVDGQLGDVGVRVGQYVTAGTQLMFVVPPRLWVTANFKEAQTAHMAPGQPAVFYVDALAGAKLTGQVERLAPATGSEFAVLKADNTTGNFVKVAQRMSVRIAVDPDQSLATRLRPGMSVEVEVDTSHRAQPQGAP
ncbi:HlyD family secretion protein [Steroidobacter sp.]|uniref:HlyD family secretion protein n=1 Tax=Steroidobacter sp. TaxID=1978227 RepID=UPI001A36F189|nr:HlyD family secretion protein [Steroidobacter sp.]MBL8268039.1 HlyD family secretion protein [Steroidobacter sp.]